MQSFLRKKVQSLLPKAAAAGLAFSMLGAGTAMAGGYGGYGGYGGQTDYGCVNRCYKPCFNPCYNRCAPVVYKKMVHFGYGDWDDDD